MSTSNPWILVNGNIELIPSDYKYYYYTQFFYNVFFLHIIKETFSVCIYVTTLHICESELFPKLYKMHNCETNNIHICENCSNM